MKTSGGVGIIGVGSYVPEKVLTNEELEKLFALSAESIFDLTGIRLRHIAAEGEATSDLAVKAALKALEAAGTSPEEIDLVIVATSTPDHTASPCAALVQSGIKAAKAAAFDLCAACSGFVYGLVMGCQVIRSGLYKKVLVIGAETVSRITNMTDRDTAILFGDGAGAVVLGELPEGYGLLGSDLGADGSKHHVLKVPAGGSRMPASEETVRNRLHTIQMDGFSVFKFAMRAMGDSALRALTAAGLNPGQLDLLVPHQANLRIIEAAAGRLDLPMEKVVVNIERYGNTSSASIPIALDEAVADGRIRRDDTIVLTGFGAGLTWASCAVRWF
jgi:3-oxoacyl-[acyl-carrier-protein] synthase-3